MGNGYDPASGKFLIPFDLKADIIDPLERLEKGFAQIAKKLDDHVHDPEMVTRHGPIATYVEHMREREEAADKRRAKTRKILIWVGSGSAPLLLALLGRAFGFQY